MLIRGQTTEQRIGQIADGFAKGLGNFQQGQDRQIALQQNADAKALQAEARKRQEALDALNVSNNISEKTGKLITPDMVAPMLKGGDFTGLGEILKSAPMNPKHQQATEDRQLEREYKQSQIDKNNRVTETAPKMSYAEKLDLKNKKAAEAKTQERMDPAYKMEKLGAEGRSKVGAIASGFQALDQMNKASAEGHGPTYINPDTAFVGGAVSDTPYTEGERMLSEVIGRLQSGGAINDQEIKTFRSLGPRPGDNHDARVRKLGQQKDFLNNKLAAFGVNNEDLSTLGMKTSSDYQGKKEQLSSADMEAIDWAKHNISDPRAKEILKLHGGN